MTDKNIFDIYGGLDTRESYGNESSILSYTEAKNIDIDGKVVRRARGQTQVSIAASGSTWAGLAPAPNGFIGGINEDGKYYRTDPVTLISTPVYSGIINIPLEVPTNLSGIYDENSGTIDLTWTNGNGTDVTIEIWLKIDSGEYALLETGLSNWLGGDIPTGVTHDVSTLGYGTFYYKVRAANGRGYSDYSTEKSVTVQQPGTILHLYHLDNSNTDSAHGNSLIRSGSTFVTDSKFGTHSLYNDTVTDWNSISDSDYIYNNWITNGGGGIDLWVKNKRSDTISGVILAPYSSDGFMLYLAAKFIVLQFNNAQYLLAALGLEDTRNKWVHIEISVASDGVSRLFVNGQLKASDSFHKWTDYMPNGKQIIIGASNYAGSLLGQIDEVRIFSKEYAHTSNFSPPSQPYTI